MKQKIICWIAVVAGAYAVKGLLLPIVAAKLAGGQESLTMMSFALGGICYACGAPIIAHAIIKRNICALDIGAKLVTVGIILMVR